MNLEPQWILLITGGILILLLASGLWVGVSLAIAGFIAFYFFLGNMKALPVVVFSAFNSFPLSSMGLFILMGMILLKSGVGGRLLDAASGIASFIPGRLLQANILASVVFGAVSGSGLAAVGTIGSVSIPTLKSKGYSVPLTLGTVGVGATIGTLIPPSNPLIIYGAFSSVSIGKLFIAGIIPGILLSVVCMTFLAIASKVQKGSVPPIVERVSLKHALRQMGPMWPVILLSVVVLGSIYGGVTTATEAGAIGCLGALIVAAIYKKLNWKTFTESVNEGMITLGMIMFIWLGAALFSYSLSNLGVPSWAARTIAEWQLPLWQLQICLFVFYLILGMFLDATSLTLCTIPITVPIIMAAGLDPIWFGVMIVIYVGLGTITPPVAVVLYVLEGMSGEPFSVVIKGVIPYIFIYGTVIVLVSVWPQIVLFLPSRM